MSGGDSINVLIVLFVATLLAAVLLMGRRQREADDRLCRHAIQRNFGVERAEAERLLARERELE